MVDGPTHKYIESSPACWALYSEVLAREYSDFRYMPVHQLTVDAYAAQHPGEPSRQSRRSVALHLISLYVTQERSLEPIQARDALKRAADSGREFPWLDPPPDLGGITIMDVHAAESPEEHQQLVRQWARSVWEAWSLQHTVIKEWARDWMA